MPAEFDKILDAIKSSLKGKINPRTKKKYTDSDFYALAVSAYKKKYGKNPMGGENVIIPNVDVIEFNVPLELVTEEVKLSEAMSDNSPMLVRGIAINETITRNGVKYPGDELRMSAHTLIDKPILKDHNNAIESIIGRTTKNVYYDETMKAVKFEGNIMDKQCKEMISDGRITNVSIGARVKELLKEEDSNGNTVCMVAKGIEFLELSVCPVPGDAQATISQALEESYDYRKALSDAIAEERVGDKMEEANKEAVPEAPKITEVAVKEEVKTEAKPEVKIETVTVKVEPQEVKVSVEGVKEVQSLIEQTTKLATENADLKKKLVEVEKLEEIKVETKGLVENKKSASEEYSKYVIEREGKDMCLWMMPNKDGTFPARK